MNATDTRKPITHRYIHVQGECVPVKLVRNDEGEWCAHFNTRDDKPQITKGKTIESAMKKAGDVYFDNC